MSMLRREKKKLLLLISFFREKKLYNSALLHNGMPSFQVNKITSVRPTSQGEINNRIWGRGILGGLNLSPDQMTCLPKKERQGHGFAK